MSVQIRAIYTCDRCGEKTSIEWANEMPKGWKRMSQMDLCSKCVEEYDKMVNDFFIPHEKGD